MRLSSEGAPLHLRLPRAHLGVQRLWAHAEASGSALAMSATAASVIKKFQCTPYSRAQRGSNRPGLTIGSAEYSEFVLQCSMLYGTLGPMG